VRALARPLRQAIAAAATLTGKRFGLLVASSLVATAGIVAAAMTNSSDLGPLAALVGRSLAAGSAPAESRPAPTGAAEPSPSAAPAHIQAPGGEAASSGPLPAPAPSAPETTPAPEPEETTPPPEEEPGPEPGPVKHVFVVSLTSSGYEAAFGGAGQMPYLSGTLRPKGELLSGLKLLDEAALPNSIAAVSGQPPNADTAADCPSYDEFPATARANSSGVLSGSGCVYPVETLSLADQLETAGLSWRAYVEGMADESGEPANCVHPEPGATETPVTGGYSSRLNPFVHFHSLLDLGACATGDVPLTGLEKDLRKIDTTASYAWVSPNLCDAGVTGQCPAGTPEGAAAADAFLARVVPAILASPAYKRDGLLIVTFGAANQTSTATAATGETTTTGTTPSTTGDPLKVGTLLLSPFLTPGATDGAAYDPYSLLRSVEDLFALEPLARAGAPGTRSFAPALGEETGGD
jgi:hypothetical protein